MRVTTQEFSNRGISQNVDTRACRLEYPARIERKFKDAYDWTARFYEHGFRSAELNLVPADESDWSAVAKWFAQALR